MNKDNINTVAHRWLNSYLKPEHICIDATCGNGNDTLFLAQRSSKVYGFDIQHQAIENTQKRCEKMTNVKLFQMSHDLMEDVVHESVDCVIFNFGYLPGGDHSISTKAQTSIMAIEQGLEILKSGGMMSLCIYSGGDSGFEERDAILEEIKKLDGKKYLVILSQYYNRPNNPPIPAMIIKM